MQVAFVGILCASFQCNNVNNRIKVWAKNNNEGKSKKHKGGRREITYELPPYAFTQSPDDYEHIKDPNKLLTVMWKDYADSTGDLDPKLNRPTRHYPAHHYRREIQQKIGWQRKESRVQDILRKATVPLPEDDCSMLPPNLRPRILEAFNKYEEWLNISNARRSANKETKQNVTDVSPLNSIPMDQIKESDSEEEDILDNEQDLNYEIADELEYWNDFEDSDVTNFDG